MYFKANIAILFLAIFPILALSSQAQSGFVISGHLDGLKDGETVRLCNRYADWHIATMMDSCKVRHGKFRLKGGFVEDGPRVYQILFHNHMVFDTVAGKPEGGLLCTLFIDNGDHVVISGGDINKFQRLDFWGEVTIEGSRSNQAKLSLWPILEDMSRCYQIINRRLKAIEDSVGFDRSLVQGQLEAKSLVDKGVREVLVNNYPYYKPAIPLLLCAINQGVSDGDYHAAFVADLYDQLDDHLKSTFYGKQLKEYARLSVGQYFPDFNLPTPDGKMISLKTFISRNKISLVHFWASNSVDVRKYQHQLRVIYKMYHSKGLDIIGVSADSVAAAWKNMVQEEEYPWINVSDLKGNLKGGIVNDVYHEGGHSIPNTTNVLLDDKGRIIAWDVDGVELQWYLWKYLGDSN
jgi:peroxiredoxin